jgi:hypothetical protein
MRAKDMTESDILTLRLHARELKLAAEFAVRQLEALRRSVGWNGGTASWAGPRVHLAEDTLRAAIKKATVA